MPKEPDDADEDIDANLVRMVNLAGEMQVTPQILREDGKGFEDACRELLDYGNRVEQQARWIRGRIGKARAESVCAEVSNLAERLDAKGDTEKANVLRDACDLLREHSVA